MRFTASPVVELPVGGAVLTFEQDNDSFEVGTSVWPSSLVLVKFAERCLGDPALPFADVLRFPDARAVELGSGCGPAGLGLSRLGLSDLVLTDIAAVLPALRRNLRRNRRHLPRVPRLAQLHWNCPAHLAQLASPRRFDLVVAADVVYVQESVPHLIAAMDALADAEHGVVLLGYQIRSPEAHQVFWDAVPTAFPVIEKVAREHLDPESLTMRTRNLMCSYSVGGHGSEYGIEVNWGLNLRVQFCIMDACVMSLKV